MPDVGHLYSVCKQYRNRISLPVPVFYTFAMPFLWGPFLLWLVLKSLYAYITDKDLRLRTWEKAGMYIFLVVLFVFFVYRNLP